MSIRLPRARSPHQHGTRRARTACAALATAALATSLAACGFVNSPDEGGEETGGGEGGGTVTAYVNTEQNTGLAPLIDAFEEETGTTLDLSSATTDELNQQLRVQLTSGTAADLIRVSPGNSSPVAAGVLGREGELADVSDAAWTESLTDDTRSLAQVDDQVVAFPVSRNAIVMAFNRQVFEDAGVEVPTTWSELLDACAALDAAGVTPIATPFQGGIYFQFWVYALAATLVYAENPDIDAQMADGETSFVDNAEWNEVFDRIAELNDAGYFSDGMLGIPPDQGLQSVATGESAMVLLVSAGLPQLYGYNEAGAEAFDVFALPGNDDAASTYVPIAPDFLAINANAENPDGARAFLDFLAEPENVEAYANEMGVLPGLGVDVTLDSDALEPIMPMFDEGRTAGYANYLWPNGDVQQTMLQSGQEWLDGSIDTANLLGQMDTEYAKGTP
ncbi:extracellular solute-binding protein family 1 [Beutenbergia cavernae DSM 12333]|uniref:Extracellular solute-binding protein family 1 n=1 Tax=Beutenbergia cavernae (strain ATCC BAA-8 / DSM 12333 / CCUG 43141 / JCM 11478 / NBRC 16432 / NCIMB 13614 / HKI 0122) TaxID=471853 RepID=C5C3K8_BEUC1|nr:extracellular solute-binding protein [Beutenbergia cavernae]ACQ81917.1 extracellular solute-binding protein family 1 [Beutenbergia cavernae DSM 12333]